MIDSRKPRIPKTSPLPMASDCFYDCDRRVPAPFAEEVKKGREILKKNAHDGDWARRNGILNLQLRAERERAWGGVVGHPGREGAFYKGVPRGFKGAIQENMRFFKVLHGGNGNLRRKVKMNLVNKEY